MTLLTPPELVTAFVTGAHDEADKFGVDSNMKFTPAAGQERTILLPEMAGKEIIGNAPTTIPY